MAKGTTVRQRENKRNASSRHNNKEIEKHGKIKENSPSQNVWKYSTLALVVLLGCLSLLYARDSALFSQTLNSKIAFNNAENVGFPCNFGEEFAIDRRSNLSLEEFVECYDAKRYFAMG